jgi:hypothetical protein
MERACLMTISLSILLMTMEQTHNFKH